MAYDDYKYMPRLGRKEAVGMDELVSQFIRDMKLSSGLNKQRVYAAWDRVTGAAPYTLSKTFGKGVLYVTLSSSVIRSQLYFQRKEIAGRINAALAEDELFTGEAAGFVKSVILK
ncbi:MAG: DUF721 domain-containing protein [Bacteroidales bacterium]|nr:DUF721 domain-containing protein [Bacteroidales bacterium]